tara:strand:- start:16321 stop:16779 length:459 start_codon:yes stop_codon:yes gene_type:complete
MSEHTFSTGTRPPEFFVDKLKGMKTRYNLVKNEFLGSYDDYKRNVDGRNRNKRSRSNWDDLKMDLHAMKVSIQGKTAEFKDIIVKEGGDIDDERKKYLDKDKQLEYKSRIIKSAKPMKVIEYNKNSKVILESLYYTTAMIMMISFMYKQYNQ